MKGEMTLAVLNERVVGCRRCPRLRRYCAEVARVKRRAFLEWEYWGKPVPGFGDAGTRIWIIGLAPAAHGANRTGRVFTGDNSGSFLYAGLYRAGLANQPTAVSRDDGLEMTDVYISATARCAPPGNKPLPEEVGNCAEYLDAEWELLERKRVVLALGRIAWDAVLALAGRHGFERPRPRLVFGHGAEVELMDGITLMGSYHVSQQNTFTGKLTAGMFEAVLRRARELAGVLRD